MRSLEDRIHDALHASAQRPVSHQSIEEAVARFQSSKVASPRRPRAGLVAATATVLVAALVVWWLARPTTDHAQPTNRPGPTQTQSPSDYRFGFVGPPPRGTPATGSATGKIVAAAQFWRATWVYADGRIISYDSGGVTDEFRGYVVRRLTPSGVQAMHSYLLEGAPSLVPLTDNGGRLIVRHDGRLMEDPNYTGCVSEGQSRYCPGFSHPEDWLPASAWEDSTFRPFVPHSYRVCLWNPHRSLPGDILPRQAADILLADPESDSTRESTCSVLSNPVARELANIMVKAGPGYVPNEESEDLTYSLPRSSTLGFEPELPHDDAFCWPGGNPC